MGETGVGDVGLSERAAVGLVAVELADEQQLAAVGVQQHGIGIGVEGPAALLHRGEGHATGSAQRHIEIDQLVGLQAPDAVLEAALARGGILTLLQGVDLALERIDVLLDLLEGRGRWRRSGRPAAARRGGRRLALFLRLRGSRRQQREHEEGAAEPV